MRHSKLKKKLLNSVGGLIRIKNKLFWHLSQTEDFDDNRYCFILPENVRYIETASTLTSGRDRVSVTLLLTGQPVRVFLSANDIDFL